MENNFIQMAASAGHAVAYTIGPIFNHIIDCVQLYFTKIRTKQWLALGASAFQCMRAGFLYPKSDNFACFIPAKIKMSFIWKDDFFCQNRHLL